jgi:TetR/AcrR family transcriptional regulator, transcriptional repressor for nem operon
VARPAEATREKLLAAAERLMLSKGYAATTVEEVCDAATLTKGAFFHHFQDKEALGRAAAARFVGRAAGAFRKAPFRRETDPLRRVFGFVDFMIDLSSRAIPTGCLVGMFSLELADTHPRIRGFCAETFSAWAEGLRKLLDDAKAAHAPRASFDTKSLALHFFAVLEGALIVDKALRRRRVVKQSLLHYRSYLATLFGRRPHRRS